MQTHTTIDSNKAAKVFIRKGSKKPTAKAKVRKFAKDFYAQYGEMMSKLSHE